MLKQNRWLGWLMGAIALLTVVSTSLLGSQTAPWGTLWSSAQVEPAQAQSVPPPPPQIPAPTVSPSPTTGPTTNSPGTPTASPTISPSGNPTTSPTTSPTSRPAPVLPAPTNPALPPPPVPSAVPPLPLGNDYRDPAGRFKIGIIKDYTINPLVGSVLVESPDGNLAYTVLVQPGTGTSSVPSLPLTSEALIQIAQTVFQRGEGFQPGTAQFVPGGVQLNWTGNLTIAGKTQPVGGVILARQQGGTLALLMIAATQTGADRVPAAIAALSNSFELLS